MGFYFRGLAFKQTMMILIVVTVVVGTIFGIMTSKMNGKLEQMTIDNGEQTSEASVTYINSIFDAAKTIGEEIAARLGSQEMTREELDNYLLRSLEVARNSVPQIIAVVTAWEPGKGPETKKGDYMKLAYFVNNESKLVSGANYDVHEWYKSTRDTKTARWQEPFIGEFVPEPIAVYTVPIFRKDKAGEDVLVGVLAIDISIDFLKGTVSSIPVSNSGFAMILSSKNVPVAYPKAVAGEKNADEMKVKEFVGSDLVEFDRNIKKAKGLILGNVAGVDAAIYYTTMKSNDWTFLVAWPVQQWYEDRQALFKLFVGLAVAGYTILLFFMLLISFRVTKPLKDLAMAAKKLGKGDFDVEIPKISGHDEVSEFAGAFKNMLDSLKNYVEAEKDVKRIERELDLARNIQLSMLPGEEREENSDDDRHELSQFLQPAKEVGGDFYDYFKIDNDHLCVVVGDVSGKGVPASLFMMVSRIMLRIMAKNMKDIQKTFSAANFALAKRNRLNMFVTVWMGIIDLRTGRIEFASAGHNPPVVRHSDGSVEFIPSKSGLVMAAMEHTVYESQTFDLKSGDTLFLYTDGVTEATNNNDELFGDQRLLSALRKCGDLGTSKICSFVKSEIDDFVQGAPQFDDITMLAVKFVGNDEPVWERYEKTVNVGDSKRGEFKTFVEGILTPMDGVKKMQMQDAWQRYEKIVDVIPENQEVLTTFVEGILAPMDASMKSQMQINIAIDEIYSNIVKFSGATEVTLIVEIRKATLEARLTFIDNGKPFDPLKQEDPDVSLSAEDREIGGLGIFIVKKTMDSVCYRRNGDHNELAIIKTL